MKFRINICASNVITAKIKIVVTTQDKLSFAPFSFGQRSCLGTNLSLLEMRFVIPQLLLNFQFNFALTEEGGNEDIEDVVEEFETFVTMRPKGGSLMVKISTPKLEEEESWRRKEEEEKQESD